jgi:hypothetical protein
VGHGEQYTVELALFSEQFSVLSCEGTKGSPSIPARPYALKNTGDFKADEKFVPGLKPRLRVLWMPGRNDAGDEKGSPSIPDAGDKSRMGV